MQGSCLHTALLQLATAAAFTPLSCSLLPEVHSNSSGADWRLDWANTGTQQSASLLTRSSAEDAVALMAMALYRTSADKSGCRALPKH